jgi:predicted nucleic acid-binding protein
MTLYADASALTKLYVVEPHSDEAAEILRQEAPVTARHSYVEVRLALHRALRGSRLRRAQDEFELDWRDANVVELDEATCRAAVEIGETAGMKTLDALHLAAAQRAGSAELTFVTFDERQAAAARSLGWTVLGA